MSDTFNARMICSTYGHFFFHKDEMRSTGERKDMTALYCE